MLISQESLQDFIYKVFVKNAFPDEVAKRAAINLVKADLRGIDSHGVARLSGYIRLAKAGRIRDNALQHAVVATPLCRRINALLAARLTTATERRRYNCESLFRLPADSRACGR